MVRSLYSGVSGMKAHQSKMDTIGNNISNVNTYGFKSSRVTFSDVFYQSTNSASAPSANAGGVNPSEIGYGAILGSVDVQHGTSTMATTANALDVAITGEGFFQVQDSEGNTFYTRAGLLNIDSYGNLVDVNGNFVLGVSGSPIGQGADDNRIQISIPNVTASSATASDSINGVGYTITSSNNTKDANITMTFIEGSDLPIGQSVAAVITSSGITVSVNPTSQFESLEAYNDAVNSAIVAAYGGTHPGGTYTVSMNPEENFPEEGLTGAQILGSNFGIDTGTISLPATSDWSYFSLDTVGSAFGSSFTTDDMDNVVWSVQKLYDGGDTDADGNYEYDNTNDVYLVTVDVAGVTYSGVATGSELSSGTKSLLLKSGTYDTSDPDSPGSSATEWEKLFTATPGADANDTITINVPTASKFDTLLAIDSANATAQLTGTALIPTPIDYGDAIASTDSLDLGLSGTPFMLTGGTAGGAQSVSDLTGIAIGGDGIIYGNHSVHGLMELGRIDLASFDNPGGLTQVGSTYFQVTANSGEPQLATAGTEGTGAIASATLEMSSVDLSGEMADMITTQRGFQANSRMITVSDTMLEELINLKR